MEVKRCGRCGSFLTSHDNICISCNSKDKIDIQKLKNYLEDNDTMYSIKELSIHTGITERNLERYMENEALAPFLDTTAEGIHHISMGL